MDKVLVVEDSSEVLSNILQLLEIRGYETVAAENGKIGLELATRERPDVIISDVTMPELDGYNLLTELRKNPLTENIPFIFLTAKVGKNDFRRGMVSGADDYVTKPFRAKDLLDAIETRLAKKRAQQKVLQEIYDNISSYVPHELRTPLVSIFGYSDMVLGGYEELSEAEVKDMVRSIRNSAERLHRSLEKFIIYSDTRVLLNDESTHKHLIDKITTTPHSIILEVISENKMKDQKDLSFKVNDGIECVPIHENHFKILTRELIDNAVKFANCGSEVSIDFSQNDSRLKMKVSNEGRGMSESEIENIQPFLQHKRRIYEQNGNGLGLAIVKNIVMLYSGNIQIESEPDGITEVEVTFPKRKECF
ncbi:MAG: response regulator [Melioribacteraceae bacterium]|nr:response regulator [Melioribacteraceae bacterium]